VGWSSDREKWDRLPCGQLHSDALVGSHGAPRYHDSHHSAPAFDRAVGPAPQNLVEQSRLEPVDLLARVAKPGDPHDGLVEQLRMD